jgi:hypothetical protein
LSHPGGPRPTETGEVEGVGPRPTESESGFGGRGRSGSGVPHPGVVTERLVICLKEIQMILKNGKGMKPGGPSRCPTTVEVVMSTEESTVGGLAAAER